MSYKHRNYDYHSTLEIISCGKHPQKWKLLVRYLLANHHLYNIGDRDAAKMIDAYFPLEREYLIKVGGGKMSKITRRIIIGFVFGGLIVYSTHFYISGGVQKTAKMLSAYFGLPITAIYIMAAIMSIVYVVVGFNLLRPYFVKEGTK